MKLVAAYNGTEESKTALELAKKHAKLFNATTAGHILERRRQRGKAGRDRQNHEMDLKQIGPILKKKASMERWINLPGGFPPEKTS